MRHASEITDTAPAVQLWCGWARKPRGKWQLLVRAASSRDIALARLRDLTGASRHVDLTVVRAGEDPNTARPA